MPKKKNKSHLTSHLKKVKKFKLILTIYLAILLILSGVFLSYIKNALIEYERSDPENYIRYALQHISDQDLTKIIQDNELIKDPLENNHESILISYKKILNNKALAINKVEDNIYDIFINKRKIFTIEIKEQKQVKKLGLLTYPIWQVENLIPYLNRGIVYVDIYVPINYQVNINGKKLTNKYLISLDKITDLEDMYYYENMPKIAKYQVNNLIAEPEIVVTNLKNEPVKIKADSYLIDLSNSFSKYNTYEEARQYLSSDIDIMKIAEQWSLFLTKDLTGNNNGFATIKNNFIEESNMYKTARSWAYGIDITFTSNHYLTSPPFTNEKVSNFIIYDENAFSCEVYLEKNMIVKGNPKTDIMHDDLYFIKYNGNWKLIKIVATKD